MKTLTRKVGKLNKRINTRKSNKKYINKRRKYTQKGRGLADAAKKAYSSASKVASKITRGPTDRETMRKLQEEIASRKKNSDRITRDCPLCMDTDVSPVAPITATGAEASRILKANDMCEPCSQCAHPFHKGCMLNYYNSSGAKPCPLCRHASFTRSQRDMVDDMRKKEEEARIAQIISRIDANNSEKSILEEELRELGRLKGPPPQRLEVIQSRLRDLTIELERDTNLINPDVGIENDSDYDSD